jgi:hypothetical protein
VNSYPINHHRHPGHCDIPVRFYHDIFDKFLAQTQENDDAIEEKRLKLTKHFAIQISHLMANENVRKKVILDFLRFLGLKLEATQSSGIFSRSMISDGSLFSSGKRRFLLCNLEVKSDFANGGCAYMQNVCYYSKFAGDLSNENRDIARRTCFPSFLILFEGISVMTQLFLYIFTCNQRH